MTEASGPAKLSAIPISRFQKGGYIANGSKNLSIFYSQLPMRNFRFRLQFSLLVEFNLKLPETIHQNL